MLKLFASLLGRPVMSLRTGAPVAQTDGLIINPNNLKIEGLYCIDRFSNERLILLPQDIRDIIPQGIAINDHDVLSSAADLIRLKDIIEIGFDVLGKQVVTSNKHRLGRATDFAIDSETLYIQKIYVSQSVFKSFNGGQLSIDRTQIVETTPHKIVVEEPLQTTAARAPAAAA